MIERTEIHEEIVRLSFSGAVTQTDNVASTTVLISGTIIAVLGSLASGSDTPDEDPEDPPVAVNTLELNVRAPGGEKLVVGTVDVQTSGALTMATLENTTVNAGDDLILDVNEIGTDPKGAGLTILIRR